MEKQKLTPTKREGYSGKLAENTTADALVKVKVPGYVPAGVRMRSRVSPIIFTVANITNAIVQLLEKDTNVVTFSINKKMHQIK